MTEIERGGLRLLGGGALRLVFAWTLLLFGGVSAASAFVLPPGVVPTLGPVPVDCAVPHLDYANPTCLTHEGVDFSLSTHIVHAGGTLVAKAHPGPGASGYSWPGASYYEGVYLNHMGSGPQMIQPGTCEAGDATCVLRIPPDWGFNPTAPSGPNGTGWQIFEFDYNISAGGVIAKDYYAILGKTQFDPSGHITDSAGKPVVGVPVHLTGAGVPAKRVYITQYFDPTHDSHGFICSNILGRLGFSDAQWAYNSVVRPLNVQVATAARHWGWHLVSGAQQGFLTHGYCSNSPWVVSLGESLTQQHDKNGTMHPNGAGHQFIGALVFNALERDLLPHGKPRPLT
ncbi:MAG TPA: hypothetical protein VMU39_17655 [Solirubrobacteraceae bacterium]|nr:hypothetical protein [Solirubrobacteraceae bacterium]